MNADRILVQSNGCAYFPKSMEDADRLVKMLTDGPSEIVRESPTSFRARGPRGQVLVTVS